MSKLSETLKVMHVTYDMRIGGTEMVIKNIIEGNKNPACEMSIFCIEEPLGPWGKALKESGTDTSTHPRKPGFDTSLTSKMRTHIKQHQIDILHCHQYTPWVYGVLACSGLKTKVIFTEHGRFYPDSSSWKRKFVNPLLAMFTHKITAISHATKQALVDYEFLKSDNIDVIYNGIEALDANIDAANNIKNKLGIPASDTIFGTIARLDPIKNHEMMLNAFAKVLESNSECTLVIVGDGDLMDALQSQVKALKIAHKVKFTGYITYPKDYLSVFDIFLLSSFSEGTSMTLLEAMSLGKPCVVTDAGGNKEIIVHEETGLVTDNNDMEQYANAMLSLAGDPEQIRLYGEQACKRFSKQFTVELMSAQYQACYGV
ncbi:glycosyltransferase family 4 protein [Glaciecola sp. SC05]|uniref:glycosyltransferase family 4 protein n=1 Tax=Glaciecola sp. SC05 TaxID=1987355 RepID=UPI00352872B2